MPKNHESYCFETTFTKRTKEGIVECVIKCDQNSDEKDFLIQMHREFAQFLEKDLKSKGLKKKKDKKNQKWMAERILGSVISSGELMFMVKWKYKNDIAFISVQQAKEKFPELVISYFEKRLKWCPIHENQSLN